MTVLGSATKAMFNAICLDTYTRAKEWFNNHKDCYQAYWAKDDFLPVQSNYDAKLKFVKEHPEIEDINDHTLVHFENDILVLDHFCPRLREGIKDFYESGYCSGDGWVVEPDSSIKGNYIVKTV